MTLKDNAEAKLADKPEGPAGSEPISPISSDVGERNAIADAATATFPIVGIGASAGGLAAFEAFFSAMPTDVDTGMAFVLVQHLAPDHKSILSDLVQRYTSMQVFEVSDGMRVHPNCAYIIPPNCDMELRDGALYLSPPIEPRGQRLPIDHFFCSLARDQHERAICIVLSGTGSDGTQGLRMIKGEGGMAMAQELASTEFDGMPRSAIATGMVDYELSPQKMPAQLIAYAAYAFGNRIRPTAPPISNDSVIKKIFGMLRSRVGHDFSYYKPSTIHRRIERRMAVHQIDSMDGYVKYLQQTPAELEALFRDLLIGVTNFFRDPDVFAALEKQIIPKLFNGKHANDSIRAWSVGCSTGEEAYSIAILLHEHMEVIKQTFKVQIFATDIDSRAIAAARAGLYSANIKADISPERLARFFAAEDGVYRIHKNIRDMVVFSEQDVIKDPPFSKLDLVSCRNLLIYMGGELQKKLMPLFHYTLNPGGYLFLGTSETIGDSTDLFSTVDAKFKFYRRKDDFPIGQRVSANRNSLPIMRFDATWPRKVSASGQATKLSLRELTEQALLKHAALSGALVNGKGEILYLHGRTGSYLEPEPGESGINNILKMAREGLRRELVAALHKAAVTKSITRATGLRVKTNGHFVTVNLTVAPVASTATQTSEALLYIVVLEESLAPKASQATIEKQQTVPTVPTAESNPGVLASEQQATEQSGSGDTAFDRLAAGATIAALNDQLRANEEYLQAANEQLETTNEELKSSNEEMQSINEELQSTNEELETSKEEMQSINEELSTVNAELQTKVAELSRTSNDMNNLLASTGIGTIFVDHELRILRFTPTITRVINLIATDVGRPVAHTVTNLVGYSSLVADAQSVLNTLVPKELEVQTSEGTWYSMRILPYRTLDNVIEGAVITFVEITEVVRARHALRKANDVLRLAVVVQDANDAITLQDLDGRILAWNPAATTLYGWSEAEALTMNTLDRFPLALRAEAKIKVQQLSRAEIVAPYITRVLTKEGHFVHVSITATSLINEEGKVYAIATTERAQESLLGN